MVIVMCIIVVVAILSNVVLYSAGRHNGIREASTAQTNTSEAYNGVIERLLIHTKDSQNAYLGIIGQKDSIITSLTKDNTDLRTSLDEMNAFIDDIEGEDEDEDDEEMEEVGVFATHLDNTLPVDAAMQSYNSTHVAMDLINVVHNSRVILEDLEDKMTPEAFTVLKTVLALPGTKNASN